MTFFGTIRREPTTDEQFAKQQAEHVRTARLEIARKSDNFTEIPRERLIARGPARYGWMVDAETDLVWARAPGIVFMPESITLITTHVDVTYYVSEAGDIVALERVTSIPSWSWYIDRQAKEAAAAR